MASEANKGVYNFLINMSINFKSTSKTSAVIGNTLKKVKKDFDNLAASASANSNTVTSKIKQVAGATTEAAKRASYFDTVWGKAFGVMMKFYTIRFFAKMFIDIGKAVYNATVNIGKFDQKLLGLYGHSAEGSKALGNVYKLSEQYGSSLDRTAEIMKKTSRYAKLLGSDMTEALVKMNQSFAYGEDTVNAIIEAFARMRDTGKVSISDMNELAENGLYVWEELRDKLGLTDEQLRTIEKSSIDVNSVMKILSDYIIKVSNEETTKINDLTIAIGRLKTDFKKFTDAITQSIGDNIFVKIINWCDEIIRRLSRIVLIASGKSGNPQIAEMQQKVKSNALTKDDITVLKNLFTELEKQNEKLIYAINESYDKLATKYSVMQIDTKTLQTIQGMIYTNQIKTTEIDKLTINSISEIIAAYGNKVAEALKTGKEIEDLKTFIENQIIQLLKLDENDNTYSLTISRIADEIIKNLNKNNKDLKKLYDDTVNNAQKNTKSINQNLIYMEQIETILSTNARTTGIRSNQPETVSEKSTSGTSEILLIQNYADKLLEELLYNIENGIIDNINGIMYFLEESMLKYIPGLASELSIGIYNALDKDEILKAFDEISNYIKRIYQENIDMLKAQNASEITIYEYQMEVQQKLLEVEKQKHEYIMQWLNNELQKAVELANKQNEANKNNKFYQTLLAMNEFFESVKKEIIIIDGATGESVKEIVDTGIPKVKSSISETLNYFKNLLSNVFADASLGNMVPQFSHFFSEVFAEIGGGIGGFVSNLIGNFSNLMLGSLFSALSQIPGIMALLDPLSYMLQVIASYILPTLNDLLSPLIGFITTLAIMIANAIIPALNAIMPFMQAIAGVLASVLTLIEPILYAVGLLLNVVIKTFLMPFTIVLQILIPIINAFIPVFKLLAKVIWFVGFVVNGIAVGIVSAINVLILTINTFLKWIGAKQIALLAIPTYTSYEDFNEQLEGGGVSVGEMVGSASNPTNSVSTSGSGSNNYTTSSQRPLNLNIYVENWFGDMTATRKLALIVKNEFEILGVL